MTVPSSNRRLALIGPALALLVAACSAPTPTPAPVPTPTPLSSDRIDSIVDSPDRASADRALDARRKPRELLAFIGVRPGITALDLSAGGGYTTELLARAIGPGGMVYGQSPPRDPNRAAPAAPEGGATPAPAASAPPAAPRLSATALAERTQRLRQAGTPAAPIVPVQQRFEDPVPAAVAEARVDLVTIVLDYHDLPQLGVDRSRMNQAVFRALRPGGVYVVVDHAGRPGTGVSESGTLHRIDEAFLRDEVEAAGFRLASEAAFLRNPADPRDRNTPEPPQPKDDFVLKFVKP